MAREFPEEHYVAFLAVGTMAELAFKRLVQAVETAPVLPEQFRTRVEEVPNGEIEGLVEMLWAMYQSWAGERYTTQQAAFVKDVCDGAREHIKDVPADFPWEIVEGRLLLLLGHHETLGVAAKIPLVASHMSRLFWDAHIVTELRPVFAEEVDRGPRAMVVTHLLRIGVLEIGDGETREIFFSLDDHDLEVLLEVIERAQEKEETLRKTITDLPVFPPTEDETEDNYIGGEMIEEEEEPE